MKLRFGLVKTSLVDYPGKVSAVLFTAGCNLRCPYCHNPELIEGPPPEEFIDEDQVIRFLMERRKVLGGVVISGGEPLLHSGLPATVKRIRDLGLQVKIDTNGTFPDRLEIIKPDFVAMDLKCPLPRYALLLPDKSNAGRVTDKIVRSINFLLTSGIPHQFRTTYTPGIVSEEDAEVLISMLRGADEYLISGFRNGKTYAPEFREVTPYSPAILSSIAERFETAGIPTRVRLNP